MMYFELLSNKDKHKNILKKYKEIKLFDYYYEVNDSFIRKIKLSNLDEKNEYVELHFIFDGKYVKIYDEKPLYAEYLAESLEKSISYSEYIAENIDKSLRYSEYIAENVEKSINYTEYIAENINRYCQKLNE